MTIGIQFALLVSIIIFYYNYVKKSMISLSNFLIKKSFISSKLNLQESIGILELVFIVISHVIFCFIFSLYLHIPLSKIFEFNDFCFLGIGLGILLGIGQMGLSSTLCFMVIRILQSLSKNKVPNNSIEWIAQSRAGWLRHHFYTVNRIPFFAAFIVILTQITAEETVFRGLILNYYLPSSPALAVGISTFLFVLIQGFLMPSKISSMFPMIGALVMGITNGILYAHIPNLVPLIIAHVVFFFFSIL